MKRAKATEARRATRDMTFDTGMLIALSRRKAPALAILEACRRSRARITIPAGVILEFWRGEHRRLLEIGALEALTPALAEQAGALLALTKGSNAVDASVVASAAQRGDIIVTTDEEDLQALAAHAKNVSVYAIG